MTEWPTVSTKHVSYLGRQFSVTVKRVKAKLHDFLLLASYLQLLVVGAAAVSRKLLTHSVFSLQALLIQTPSECLNRPPPGKLSPIVHCAEQVCTRCGEFLDLFMTQNVFSL